MRSAVVLLLFALCAGLVCAQTPADSARVAADTVYVIPAGPIAGSFTAPARLVVVDTVAGWAKIQMEGWVPVRTVLARMKDSALPLQKVQQKTQTSTTAPSGQCEGRTKKGTRCKRKAAPGSVFCWQHQP